MSEGIKSQHAELLNALDYMQDCIIYAARKSVLQEAERVIVAQERQLAALTLTWREQRPTEAGAYWWREDETGEPVMTVVDQMTSGLLGVNFPGSTEYHAVADWGGEWAGPLVLPREK